MQAPAMIAGRNSAPKPYMWASGTGITARLAGANPYFSTQLRALPSSFSCVCTTILEAPMLPEVRRYNFSGAAGLPL